MISVIIPFKDRLDWVEQAVDSVLNQTFKDFELILVDDGSTNNYSEQFKKLDSRIIYIKQSNKGAATARNVGIKHAKGEYITFLDSDDLFLPTKLETQICLMKENNASLSHTSYCYFTMDKEMTTTVHSGEFSGFVYPAIYEFCPIATPTVMVKRSLFDEFYFPENLKVAEDVVLWAKISKKFQLLGIDIPLTQVRLHGKNAAFDYGLQIEGLMNIISYGVLTDTEISLNRKRLILSNLNFSIAYCYIRQRKLGLSIKHILYAFFNDPFNGKIYKRSYKYFIKKISQQN